MMKPSNRKQTILGDNPTTNFTATQYRRLTTPSNHER